MKFIEIVEGFSLRIDSIVSVNRVEHNRVKIETESREYELPADYNRLMQAIEFEEQKEENVQQGLTSQYFSL